MSEKNVIVTGINGFVGEHVAREFKALGYSVTGVGHDAKANQKVGSLLDRYISCDLLNEEQVHRLLDFRDVIAMVHLAGLANVGQSFEQPRRYMTDNGVMVHNLLSKAQLDNAKGRVVVVSTGALYDPRQPLPLSESSETSSNSPYAVGKLMTEDVASYYRTRGIDTVVVRPFNHIGPGQGPGFILPDLFAQLQAAEQTGIIMVGNLDTKRDYTDVRDIARAYGKLALATSLRYNLYNICSGSSVSGKEILGALQSIMDADRIDVRVDESKIRPNDITEIVGDSTRLQNELEWKPEIEIEQTIKDFVKASMS